MWTGFLPNRIHSKALNCSRSSAQAHFGEIEAHITRHRTNGSAAEKFVTWQFGNQKFRRRSSPISKAVANLERNSMALWIEKIANHTCHPFSRSQHFPQCFRTLTGWFLWNMKVGTPGLRNSIHIVRKVPKALHARAAKRPWTPSRSAQPVHNPLPHYPLNAVIVTQWR